MTSAGPSALCGPGRRARRQVAPRRRGSTPPLGDGVLVTVRHVVLGPLAGLLQIDYRPDAGRGAWSASAAARRRGRAVGRRWCADGSAAKRPATGVHFGLGEGDVRAGPGGSGRSPVTGRRSRMWVSSSAMALGRKTSRSLALPRRSSKLGARTPTTVRGSSFQHQRVADDGGGRRLTRRRHRRPRLRATLVGLDAPARAGAGGWQPASHAVPRRGWPTPDNWAFSRPGRCPCVAPAGAGRSLINRPVPEGLADHPVKTTPGRRVRPCRRDGPTARSAPATPWLHGAADLLQLAANPVDGQDRPEQ